MSAIAKLIKGGAWLTLANVIAKLASALAIPILARLLNPESLGIYSIVVSLTQSAQGFSTLGADIAMQRNGAQYKTVGTETVGRLFGVGLSLICLVSTVTGLGIWLFRYSLAKYWLGQPELINWLGAAALLIVLQPFSNVFLLFLASLQDFRAYALRSSVETIFTSALTVLLGWKFGIAGAVQGLILAAIIKIPWSYLVAKPVLLVRGIRLRFDKFWHESRSILKFGFPYYFGNTMLGSLVGLPLMGLVTQYGGLKELGYLRVAQSIAALISFIPSAIAPAAISYLSASSTDDYQSYQYLKSVHLRGVWILLLLPTGIFSLILPEFINSLFGGNYKQAVLLSWLSLWISLIAGLTSVLVQYLVVVGKTFIVSLGSSIGVICWIGAAFFLVPRYHALGFLISQAIGQIAGLFIVLRPAIIDISLTDQSLLKTILYFNFILFLWTLLFSLINLQYYLNYLLALATTIFSSVFVFINVLYPHEKSKLVKILEIMHK